MEHQPLRTLMCDIGRRVWTQGWAAANDGNFSVKLGENLFLVTPTGVSKGFLTPEMPLLVDGEGNPLEPGDLRPSSEFPMHLRCYAERPDIGAVVHAHPPVTTAFAVAHQPLTLHIAPETILTIGSVPIAPYGCPSTEEIPENLAPFLEDHDAVMLENHGAVTVGADLLTAYYRMETLEYYAKLCLNTRLVGGAHELPPHRLEELMALRRKFAYGGRHPGIEVRKDG